MRYQASPIERDPELIQSLGLISARWAALESDLSELLGALLRVPQAGDDAYYCIGNFTQRIDLVQSLVAACLNSPRHARMAEALFLKIKRLWKSRNYLLHSHYVHLIQFEDGARQIMERQNDWDFDIRLSRSKVVQEGYAYEAHKPDGSMDYVPVNKGTFLNHANQLAKRSRQVALLTRAIYERITHLKKSAYGPSLQKRHPRSRGDLRRHPARPDNR